MITIKNTLHVNVHGQGTMMLPPSVKPGEHQVVIQIEEEPWPATTPRRAVPKAGCLKGIWMAPDFDAPLEDFREYME